MKDFISIHLSDLNLFTKKIFSDLFTQLFNLHSHTCRWLQANIELLKSIVHSHNSIKGRVHPEIKILSLITHPHVVPNT